MSARAAWRLEGLGFGDVFRYVGGKADWLANGLPIEGTRASVPRAGDAARRDAPTCGPGDRVGAVRDRVRAAGWDVCLVVNREKVVLGRLRARELAADPAAAVDAVMEEGPGTIRPDTSLDAIARRMQERNLAGVVVTLPDGRLVGVLLCPDAEKRLGGGERGQT